MKSILIAVAFLTFSLSSFSLFPAPIDVEYSSNIYDNSSLVFEKHQGAGRFDSSLAMNITYEPVVQVRTAIESTINKKLDYFKQWNPYGEAHITVVTPPEYYDILRQCLTMDEIEDIAEEENIQNSFFEIEGIGSGKVLINSQEEETYFLIVKSQDLINVREKIYDACNKNGGSDTAWDYSEFYPHITIGYTKRDLHIQDGVVKDVAHSLDGRFKLIKN